MLQHCGLDSQFRNFGILVQNKKKKKDEITLLVPQCPPQRTFWVLSELQALIPDPPGCKSHPRMSLRSPCTSKIAAFPIKTAQEGAERSPALRQSLQEPSEHSRTPQNTPEPPRTPRASAGHAGVNGEQELLPQGGLESPSSRLLLLLLLLLTLSCLQLPFCGAGKSQRREKSIKIQFR